MSPRGTSHGLRNGDCDMHVVPEKEGGGREGGRRDPQGKESVC